MIRGPTSSNNHHHNDDHVVIVATLMSMEVFNRQKETFQGNVQDLRQQQMHPTVDDQEDIGDSQPLLADLGHTRTRLF